MVVMPIHAKAEESRNAAQAVSFTLHPLHAKPAKTMRRVGHQQMMLDLQVDGTCVVFCERGMLQSE